MSIEKTLKVNESFTSMIQKIFGLLKLHGIKAVLS